MSDILSYQCPNCEAPLKFDPKKQSFSCEYCTSSFTKEELENLLPNKEITQKEETESQEDFFEDLEEYECPNCGASVACTGNTAATFCLYCHTPVLHKGKLSGVYKPFKMIPFVFDQNQAEQKLLDFVSKYHFVPKGFFSKEQRTYLRGVYYPYWLTDADCEAELSARCTKVRTWVSGEYQYTETSYFSCEREGDVHFEDIATCGVSDEDKRLIEGILPFPSERLIPFSMTYLSGFLTKKRDIESSALENEVQNRMNTYSKELLRNTIRYYDSINIVYHHMNVLKENWEYALLPVYVMHYKWKDKDYIFGLNGCTGKVYGELPIDWGKVFRVAGIIAGAILSIALIIGGFL